MKRRIFTILLVTSLVLCVAMVVMWVRSHWVGDSILYAATDRYYFLRSVDGTVDLGAIEQHLMPEDSRFTVFDLGRGLHAFIGWSYDGLSPRAYFGVGPETNSLWRLSLSYWLLVIAFSVIPVTWLYRWWTHWRRYTIGTCHRCGHDLRSIKERCPECGTAIEASLNTPAAP